MARKDDTEKLLARENRRRVSLVGSIAGVEPVSPDESEAQEERQEARAPVAVASPVVVATPAPIPSVVEDPPAPADLPPDADAPLIKSVVKPQKREARTARRQVVLTPSLNRAIDRKLRAGGLSFNEVVHQLLQNWVDAE